MNCVQNAGNADQVESTVTESGVQVTRAPERSRSTPTERTETCSVEGCFHVVRNMKLSLCSRHYQRHLRYGDTSFTKTVRFVPKFRGRPQP